MFNDELYHHGILGQKWGIRRFQNKDGTLTEVGKKRKFGDGSTPIEDTVLRSGTRLSSVSVFSNSERYRKSARRMYTYNPDDEWDNSVYKGPFSAYKRMQGYAAVYEHQFETVKDLKMPTKKERVDEFLNLYADKKIGPLMKQDLKGVQEQLKRSGVKGTENIYDVDVNDIKTETDKRAAYEIFNHAMEAADHFKSTSAYVKVMSKKYDAMVDDNNQRIYNNAHDPVIIFNTKKALKTIGDVKLVDDQEIVRNLGNVRTEQQKRGETVKF